VCRCADLTAVIGLRPNVKPLQRHKGVGLRNVRSAASRIVRPGWTREDTRCSCWRRTKLIRRHDPDAELAFRLTFYLCEGRSTGPTSDAVTASDASASFSGTVSIQPYTPGLQQAVLEVTRR
jgi:hypothetical protein